MEAYAHHGIPLGTSKRACTEPGERLSRKYQTYWVFRKSTSGNRGSKIKLSFVVDHLSRDIQQMHWCTVCIATQKTGMIDPELDVVIQDGLEKTRVLMAD